MDTLASRRTSLALAFGLIAAMTPAVAADSHQSKAVDYCQNQGGEVVKLKPTLNPNSDAPVELAGSVEVCQFISSSGDQVEQLVVDLNTVHSEKPTLAGLAYLAQVPSSNSGAAGSNPASSYCPDDLNGTEAFGTSGNGAWVGELDPGMEAGFDPPLSDVINLCMFADGSFIDDFGVFYASDGTYRGVDLAKVMRYQPGDDTPDVFASDA